jgi:hypothetical protein
LLETTKETSGEGRRVNAARDVSAHTHERIKGRQQGEFVEGVLLW